MNATDIRRLVACLLAKRFLIITGLSGSGKTRTVQAFARWLTPSSHAGDPFIPGFRMRGEQGQEYVVVSANDGIVEFEFENGKLLPLPRKIIEEWADYIELNQLSKSISGKELRERVAGQSKFYPHLQRIESHYKPAAFALVESRKAGNAIRCHAVIPVGADWTSNESVLGYPDGLNKESYITKPALDLMLQAQEHPDIPHFLILDEMNLSHVERYFADILSAIESNEEIVLHGDKVRKADDRAVPGRLALPGNLFIMGTVNVDETTYMFSPKVLDRANVIEFRMDANELKAFLGDPSSPDLPRLDAKGTVFAGEFVARARQPAPLPNEIRMEFEQELLLFFNTLQENGAEFGYRVAHEAARYMHFHHALGDHPHGDASWFRPAFDCVIIQKLLPKLHGSRARLGPVLRTLWFLCMNDPTHRGPNALQDAASVSRSSDKRAEPSTAPELLEKAHYRLSAEKIGRMWRLLHENGFASFAET